LGVLVRVGEMLAASVKGDHWQEGPQRGVEGGQVPSQSC
jgi:hypothetical protein